jgi:hypothetical protein
MIGFKLALDRAREPWADTGTSTRRSTIAFSAPTMIEPRPPHHETR